jgi:hypothetical protein
MYQKHPAFETPAKSTIVWRYMSFAKFVWLIAKEELFFSRLDQHADDWEGFLPRNSNCKHQEYIRFNAYVNCWHMNDVESDAMWKIYESQIGEAVAVKSSVGRLIQSLEKAPLSVYIGQIDYREQNGQEENLYIPVTHKRKAFEHEKELRLCISSGSSDNPPDFSKLKEEFVSLGIEKANTAISKNLYTQWNPKGIPVRVDLTKLIDGIILPPKCGAYLKECVECITQSKIPKPVITCSDLCTVPNDQ